MGKHLALLLATAFILSPQAVVAAADSKTPYKNMAIEATGADKSKAAEINNDGVRHFHGRHWSESGEYFENALKKDPNLAEAHFNLGLVHHKKGRHGKAKEHFKKAAELAPGNERIQNSKVLKEHLK